MIEQAIFYADGRVLTTKDIDGDPSNVPARGVVAVVKPSRNGQRVRWGTPYYVYREEHGEFYEASQDAMWFYLSEPGWKRVLFGTYITDAEMEQILLRAKDFYKGQKTWQKVERPSEGR